MAVCFSAPVINNRSNVVDLVEEIFCDRGAQIEIREHRYDYYPEQVDFYREQGITRVVRGVLMIERAPSFSTPTTRPNPATMRASRVMTSITRRLRR